MIKCVNLTKKYYESNKNEITVIDNISFKIKMGEFLIITGPSGSGKTTFLYLLSGLEKPTIGEVFFQNKNINHFSNKEKQLLRQNDVGFVFQNYQLINSLNVFDNVSLPLLIKNEKIDVERVNKILALTKILNKSKSYPEQLSGGMKQRVAIARSIIHNPKVIFADEPTGNLDKSNAEDIMEIFKTINERLKTTIILVTHNLNHLPYATRTIELVDAKIKSEELIE